MHQVESHTSKLPRHKFRVYPVKVTALERESVLQLKDFLLIVKAAQTLKTEDHWVAPALTITLHKPSFRKGDRKLARHVWSPTTDRPLPAQG